MTLSYYFQVLFSLFVIVSILFLVYKFSLRYKKQLFSGELKVLDRVSVEKGMSVVLVSHKDKSFLLGVSHRSVSLIKEISL
ncbi:hypothetical protein DID78_05145 [Candidatus Marinamargulisbacteria bacterium SCGC AG-343-D04]|nr:hypothetical protein DID78_05145 [Candidatus Marinamargulisbacteria bacterium SCGC AG-343-D04]